MQTVTIKGVEFTPIIPRSVLWIGINRIANQIVRSSYLPNLHAFVVLNGAAPFATFLITQLMDLGCKVNPFFLQAASYKGMQSTGEVTVNIPYDSLPERCDDPILIIEDIVDTGETVRTIRAELTKRGYTNVMVASLLVKPATCRANGAPDFWGFSIRANEFVVGFGMDYDGEGRDLPAIYLAKKSV